MPPKRKDEDLGESSSKAFKLEPEAITPPKYRQAVTTAPIGALYGAGIIPEGTPVRMQEPNTSDLFLRSTVWYAENPTRYFWVFDGMQDFKLKEHRESE